MSDLAQWIRDARETVAGAGARGEHIAIRPVVLDALLDVAEAAGAKREAERLVYGSHCTDDATTCELWMRLDTATAALDAALARLAEVKP